MNNVDYHFNTFQTREDGNLYRRATGELVATRGKAGPDNRYGSGIEWSRSHREASGGAKPIFTPRVTDPSTLDYVHKIDGVLYAVHMIEGATVYLVDSERNLITVSKANLATRSEARREPVAVAQSSVYAEKAYRDVLALTGDEWAAQYAANHIVGRKLIGEGTVMDDGVFAVRNHANAMLHDERLAAVAKIDRMLRNRDALDALKARGPAGITGVVATASRLGRVLPVSQGVSRKPTNERDAARMAVNAERQAKAAARTAELKAFRASVASAE